MVEIIWDEKFKKIYRKWIRKHPNYQEQFSRQLLIFENDPFHPALKTHSLNGILEGLWSCRITYEYRLVFDFVDEHRAQVILIDIGTHDEVY